MTLRTLRLGNPKIKFYASFQKHFQRIQIKINETAYILQAK